MTTQEYLEQIHELEVKIEQRTAELQSIKEKCSEAQRAAAEKCSETQKAAGDKNQGSQKAAGAKNSRTKKKPQIEDIEKIKEECERLIRDMTVQKHEIIGIIHRLTNVDHIQVLEMRYIKRLTFEQIALIMSTSARQVYRYHDAALVEFENKIKDVSECQV